VIAIEHESIAIPLFPKSILGHYEDLLMLKFTSLAVGLLTAISIVPAAQARPIYDRDTTPVIIQQPVRAISPQVIVVTPQARQNVGYRTGWTADRYRQLELIREREARARWEAKYSRYGRYDRNHRWYNDRYDYRYNEYRR
jgi:hypothetical protein